MGLVLSTGIFRFIPPNPSIDGISSVTGHINDTIRLFGNDLDYIDSISLAGQNCNFNLIDIGNIDISIPSNSESGYIVASSKEFNVTGNPIVFYPIPLIENFSPSNSASGELVTINGQAINTATGAYLLSEPLIDDIPYTFSGDINSFILATRTPINNSDIILTQNINKDVFTGEYRIKNLSEYTPSSGKRIEIGYNEVTQRYYENHIFSYLRFSSGDNFQSFKTGLNSGFNQYLITLPSGRQNKNYSIFYSPVFTGDYYNSFISGKNENQFYLNFDSTLSEFVDVNVITIKHSPFVFDLGNYDATGIRISSGVYSTGINFQNNKLYAPFLLTSCEYSGDGSGYIYNISNFNKDSFNLNIPNTGGNYNFTLNYCTIINPQADLNTFSFFGESGAYYKIYLFSGDANSFKEAVYVNNYQNINKNQATFQVPYSDGYINGPINLIGPESINSISNNTFYETPLVTGVFPPLGIRGTNLILSGKSFKKPILNDGTGDYNYITVNFRYADNIFKQNINSFSTDFIWLDFNTLSGAIPLKNFNSGRYAIQMIAENGSLYE